MHVHCQTQKQVIIDREKTVLQRKALAPVVLTTRGRVVAVEGIACAGGNVAAAEAEAMVASATAVLRARLAAVAGPPEPATAGGGGGGGGGGREDTTVRIDVKVEVDSRTFSSGGGLTLWAVTDSGARIGGSALLELPRAATRHKRRGGGGSRGRGSGRGRAQDGRGGGGVARQEEEEEEEECQQQGVAGAAVGVAAAEALLRELAHGGAVDEHLADQLVVFMALAAGRSRLLTGPLSMHTQTALHLAGGELTGGGCKIEVEDLDGRGHEAGNNLITCDGIGHHV
eukprot:COSAG06_NODE_3915_length_4773_cov_6.394309_5_plen_285_part_00